MSESDQTYLEENWPYDYVEKGEVRTSMNFQETKELRQELEELRETVDEWSCDRCGEEKSTAIKGDEHLCNSCIFGS